MSKGTPLVSLGIAKESFPAGVHVCQIFNSDEERLDALLAFVLSGLEGGERTACFSDKLDEEDLARHLDGHGMSYRDLTQSGALTRSSASEVYFADDRFDPDRMLGVLEKFHTDSLTHGFPAARVIGEMNADIRKVPGGSRLMEYEARVSLLLKQHPVTSVCQYDARAFDGATIMQVLKVHPLMVIRGTVIHNPFCIPPEEYLAQHC